MRYTLPALLLILPVAVRGQGVELDSAQTVSARAALFSVELESPIRIRTVGQAILEGRLASRSDTGVVIRHHGATEQASIRRIWEIWRPVPNYKSGAIVGGVTGAVVGGLVSGALASGLCDRADCHGAFVQGAAVGAGLFGALGIVIGLGVGSISHHWETFWLRPS